MTQPFKTCPNCQQNAVLSMITCQRCGYVYPNAPQPRNQFILNLNNGPQTAWDRYLQDNPKVVLLVIVFGLIVGLALISLTSFVH